MPPELRCMIFRKTSMTWQERIFLVRKMRGRIHETFLTSWGKKTIASLFKMIRNWTKFYSILLIQVEKSTSQRRRKKLLPRQSSKTGLHEPRLSIQITTVLKPYCSPKRCCKILTETHYKNRSTSIVSLTHLLKSPTPLWPKQEPSRRQTN